MAYKRSSERGEVQKLKPVQLFLESKGRRSTNTRKAYLNALVHFNNFLKPQNAETILQSILERKTNVYELLDNFLNHLISLKKITTRTAIIHLTAIKSYLQHRDVDIIPGKFKKKVTVPKFLREDEQAIDAHDIRNILIKCNNRRLKTYLPILASGGMRTVEALAIRIKDVDFNVRPTKIHIRGEFSKTCVARDIYISDEATQTLRDWINWKYRNGKSKAADDLIFHDSLPGEEPNPRSLYSHIAFEFSDLRKLTGFAERKDNSKRHVITLHSLRRFVDTTISDAAGKDYAEWFLGHAKSSYWVKKESEKREIYNTKCMKHLTFLDYTALETMGRNTEADLEVKAKEIAALRQQTQIMSNKSKTVEQELAAHMESKDKQLASQANEIQSLKGQMEMIVRQMSQLNETVQNYKDDYNWKKAGYEVEKVNRY